MWLSYNPSGPCPGMSHHDVTPEDTPGRTASEERKGPLLPSPSPSPLPTDLLETSAFQSSFSRSRACGNWVREGPDSLVLPVFWSRRSTGVGGWKEDGEEEKDRECHRSGATAIDGVPGSLSPVPD